MQGSNSIEGYGASLDDVIAAMDNEDAVDAASETVFALQGYRDAMTYVLQLADDAVLDINEQLVKSLHFMMMKHDLSKRPGRYRLGSIFVVRESDGLTVYEGPDAELVPELMNDLLEGTHDSDGSVLVRAAMSHLNLVMIHPFSDGNGRMGRCLQTLVLTRDRFCLNAHYQCAETMLWRVQEAEELWEACTALVVARGLPERSIGPLSDAPRGLRVRNASYRLAAQESFGTEIDVPTASRDLRACVTAGLLEAHGETRGRFYLRSDELQVAFRQIRAKKPTFEKANLFGPDGQQRLDLTTAE